MKKAITMLLSLVLLLGVLTGCGAQSKMATAETAAAQYVARRNRFHRLKAGTKNHNNHFQSSRQAAICR